jgi:hypothetical protein
MGSVPEVSPVERPWTAFETTVKRIARDLDSNPMRIIYAKRRHALIHWQMPEAD